MDPAGFSQQIFCPQCGAPAPFRGQAVSLVCEFCESTIVRTGVDVTLLGKVSALIDNGSPIVLGSRGRFEGLPFEVSGRLQVGYARGTWNEWFLTFADGSTGWLADAMGQYAVLRPRDPNQVAGRVPTFDALPLNGEMTVLGISALVVDRRAAAYKGAEGMLPMAAAPGTWFFGADLRGFDGEFITLDYGHRGDHAMPTPYVGRTVDLLELALHPVRAFEGWQRPVVPGAVA